MCPGLVLAWWRYFESLVEPFGLLPSPSASFPLVPPGPPPLPLAPSFTILLPPTPRDTERAYSNTAATTRATTSAAEATAAANNSITRVDSNINVRQRCRVALACAKFQIPTWPKGVCGQNVEAHKLPLRCRGCALVEAAKHLNARGAEVGRAPPHVAVRLDRREKGTA